MALRQVMCERCGTQRREFNAESKEETLGELKRKSWPSPTKLGGGGKQKQSLSTSRCEVERAVLKVSVKREVDDGFGSRKR